MQVYGAAETVGGLIWNSGRVQYGPPLFNAIRTLSIKQAAAIFQGKHYCVKVFIMNRNKFKCDMEVDAGHAGILDAINGCIREDSLIYYDYVVQIEIY